MEIYTNSVERTVTLQFPVVATGGTIDVDVYDGTQNVFSPTAVTYDSGVYAFDLPLSLVQSARELRINWKFDYVENSTTYSHESNTYVEVVTPLVTVDIARQELDIPIEVTDEQIRLTERRVRKIIETVTGQVFAAYSGTFIGTQLPDGSVRLPHKMLSLTSVNGVANTLYYVLAGNGWKLAIVYPLKRDGFRAGGGEVPIVDPFAKFRAKESTKVSVTGRWGYERVPTDITEAALILIEQQLCPDSLYRERYIKTMTAADMRFEFHPGAYAGTGNVVADQILSRYVQGIAAVI